MLCVLRRKQPKQVSKLQEQKLIVKSGYFWAESETEWHTPPPMRDQDLY